MPSNIRKFYRIGSCGKQTSVQRYNYIMKVLEQYCGDGAFDFNDLKWHLQNAMCERVFISKEAAAIGLSAFKPVKDPFVVELRDKLLTYGRVMDANAVELRKIIKNCLVFEHVVPTKVHLDELIRLYKENKLTFELYEAMKKKLPVCLVTKEEDKALGKHYRQSMPEGSDWVNGNEWARYDEMGITVNK